MTDEELASLKAEGERSAFPESAGLYTTETALALIAEVERLKAELTVAWDDDELADEVAAHEKTKREVERLRTELAKVSAELAALKAKGAGQ